jgi:hypothetical protein
MFKNNEDIKFFLKACSEGDLDTVRTLLDKGVYSDFGIAMASRGGHPEVVKLLLSHENINQAFIGRALKDAPNVEIMKLLIPHIDRNKIALITECHTAVCEKGDVEALRLLIESGLTHYVYMGIFVRNLLERGNVDVRIYRILINTEDSFHISVFHEAVRRRRLDVAELLINKVGRDSIISNRDTFEWVSRNHDIQGAKWLVEKGFMNASHAAPHITRNDAPEIYKVIREQINDLDGFEEGFFMDAIFAGAEKLTRYLLINSFDQLLKFIGIERYSEIATFGNNTCFYIVLRDRRLYNDQESFRRLVELYEGVYFLIKEDAKGRLKKINDLVMLHKGGKISRDNLIDLIKATVDLKEGIYPLKDYQNEENNVKQAMKYINRLLEL